MTTNMNELAQLTSHAAAQSDRWVSVKPGTDTALALGLMHILEREGLADHDFIARRTVGYERLRDEVLPRYAPAAVAATTGVPVETLELLARRLAELGTH